VEEGGRKHLGGWHSITASGAEMAPTNEATLNWNKLRKKLDWVSTDRKLRLLGPEGQSKRKTYQTDSDEGVVMEVVMYLFCRCLLFLFLLLDF
jgi:hypothetical protein